MAADKNNEELQKQLNEARIVNSVFEVRDYKAILDNNGYDYKLFVKANLEEI